MLFAAATVGWFAAGLAAVAIAFAVLVGVNLTLLFAWGQREH